MKRILFVASMLALLAEAAAQQEYTILPQNSFVDGGMWFRQITDTTAEVSEDALQGMALQDPLVIPRAVQDSAGNTFTVTRIGDRAFDGRQIANINLPTTLREIGSEAFANNAALQKIDLPSGLQRIGDMAFFACTLTDTVRLPDSLVYVSPTAFTSNTARTPSGVRRKTITHFDIANSRRFCTAGGILYSIDSAELLMAPGALADTFYVPQHVRRIGRYALTDCEVTHVIFNDSLREIGIWALPLSVTNVKIPALVTHIDGSISSDVNAITITVDSASRNYKVAEQMLLSFDGDTLVMGFGTWTGVKEVPEGIKVIASRAFYGMRSSIFDSIGLPNSLEEICDEAFAQNSIKINFPQNLRKPGTRIIDYAYSIRTITLPNTLTEIADYALAGSFIETITIGDSIRVIPRGMLYNSFVTKINFGSNVEHIMPEAFAASNAGAWNLTFNNNNFMPATLRTIGRDAFRERNIPRIKFHNNPDTVGAYAFNRTQRVFFNDTVPPVVFENSFAAGCDVYVPCHGNDIFTSAPGWGPGFNYIESPCPTTAVDDEAATVDAFTIAAEGDMLYIERTMSVEVGVYDIQGRLMKFFPPMTGEVTFQAPATGVYVIKAGGTAKRALLVKH